MEHPYPATLGKSLLTALCALTIGGAHAASGSVALHVTGISASSGEVGCALFSSPDRFPMDSAGARQVWLRADRDGVVCTFDDVPEGRWAVSVSHDLNGNHKVDTNFFGVPVEPWGVSNNVRPTLRAPRFDEAAFRVEPGQATLLEVKVAK